MQTRKSLSAISADRELWIAQYRQEIFERDRISGLAAAKEAAAFAEIDEGLLL